MLIALNVLQHQLFLRLQRRQHSLLGLFLVLGFVVQHGVAVKLHPITGRAEGIAIGVDQRPHRLHNAAFHLAGHKPFPHQLVDLKLVGGQAVLGHGRRQRGGGGTDGFVAVLGIFTLVDPGSSG